jgi:hypothetical protein
MNHQRVAPTAITTIAAAQNKKRKIARKLAPGRQDETVSVEEGAWVRNRGEMNLIPSRLRLRHAGAPR